MAERVDTAAIRDELERDGYVNGGDVSALLDEIDRLRGAGGFVAFSLFETVRAERDSLRAENERLSDARAEAHRAREMVTAAWTATIKRADAAEAKLAAAQEAAHPLTAWLRFHTANYGGNPPDRRLAISYETAPVWLTDIRHLVAALGLDGKEAGDD